MCDQLRVQSLEADELTVKQQEMMMKLWGDIQCD